MQDPGSFHHVTSRGNRGQAIFHNESDRQALQIATWRTGRELGWECLSFCFMDNHIHLLLRLESSNLSVGMQRIGTAHAKRYNERNSEQGRLFQERFRSRAISSQGHLRNTIRYIALNPVRAGLCAKPEEYAWSSHRSLIGLEPARLVAAHSTLELFGSSVRAYESFVADRDGDTAFSLEIDRDEPSVRAARISTLHEIARSLDRDALVRRAHRELGYTTTEIAGVLNCHHTTVSRRLKRLG
jgi:putative transposase